MITDILVPFEAYLLALIVQSDGHSLYYLAVSLTPLDQTRVETYGIALAISGQ